MPRAEVKAGREKCARRIYVTYIYVFVNICYREPVKRFLPLFAFCRNTLFVFNPRGSKNIEEVEHTS